MILVTGATGFLGSHVMFELVKAGLPVRGLFRNKNHIVNARKIFGFYDSHADHLFKKIQWISTDITNYHDLLRVLDNVNEVYHTAGLVSFNDRDKAALYRVNIEGTANIVNACLEKKGIKLCHVSSVASLGTASGNELINESLIWNEGSGSSVYAQSKFYGEMEVWRGINEGLQAVIVNPSVIIGPGMWQGAFKDLFITLNKGLQYYTFGSAGYVDVRDVAKIMIKLMQHNHMSERFIINSENITHQQFLISLTLFMHKQVPRYAIPPYLAKTAIILEMLRAVLTSSNPRITFRSFKIAQENLRFSSEKVLRTFPDYFFIPVKESLKNAVSVYSDNIPSTRK